MYSRVYFDKKGVNLTFAFYEIQGQGLWSKQKGLICAQNGILQ